MLQHQRGVILLTTTLVLSLVMLLLLAQIELIILNQKAHNQTINRALILQHLENLAAQLSAKINYKSQDLHCVISKLDPNKVIDRIKKQKVGCLIADNKYNYHYVIEYLGQFNCIRVKSHGNDYATNQWRLTIAALLSTKSVILQLRIATLTSLNNKICKRQVVLAPDVLSWRYLS